MLPITNESKFANYWLVNPDVDLMLCCGGLVWLLFGAFFVAHGLLDANSWIQPFVALDNPSVLTFFFGSILFVDTHFGLTLTRTYNDQEFLRGSRRLIYTLLLLLGVMLVVSSSRDVCTYLCKLYLFLVTLHYTMQNHSLVRTYLRRAEYKLDAVTSVVLSVALILPALNAIYAQFVERSLNVHSFAGLTMPFWGSLPAWPMTLFTYISMCAWIILPLQIGYDCLIKKQHLPLPAAILSITVGGFFLFTGPTSSILWSLVPAFLHSSQSVAIGIAERLGAGRKEEVARPLRDLILFLFNSWLLGVVIVFALPQALSMVGFDPMLTFPAILVVFSFYHFAAEAILSKRALPTRRRLSDHADLVYRLNRAKKNECVLKV